MKYLRSLCLIVVTTLLAAPVAHAASAQQLQTNAQAALARLYAANPKTVDLGKNAYAILIFPTVVRAGALMAGFERGDGVLYVKDKVKGYYNTTSAVGGMQVGVQTYSYALFFMTKDDMKDLGRSSGFNLGASPTLTVADKGLATNPSLYTLSGIKAFVFGQKGLMAGLGIKAQKISEYTPSK